MAELSLEQRRAIAIAQARARAAKQQPQGEQQQPQRGTFDRFARGFGGGLANLAGLPIGAAMEAGNLTGLTDFEDTSGANFLKRKLEPLGITASPEEDLGLAGAVGEGASQYGTIGLGITRGLASRGAGLISGGARAPAATAGGRILDDMAVGAARAPAATGASEVAAAGGEAFGRGVAEGAYGGGWQADVGGLIGGITGGLSPAAGAAGTRKAIDFASDTLPMVGVIRRSAARLFGLEPGGAVRRRASDRLRSVAEQPADPGDALPAQRNLRQTADVDSSLLTPAQQTDDPGIMSLAARQRADDPAVLANWRVQVEENMSALRRQLKDVTGDEVADIQRRYGENIDDMAVVAVANAERRLQRMTPNQRRDAASKVVREELDSAYRIARNEESALWDQVPEDMVMPAEAVRARYAQLQGQITKENAEDMPLKAKQFLDPDSPDSYFRADADGELLTDVLPLQRLQKLRSALLNEARNAGSGATPNRNRARLARELADGLLDDMASVDPRESPGTGAFLAAKDFSRHLNDRFTRGPVGDVLQSTGRGDSRIPAELTMDRTVGRGGIQAARTSRAFKAALENPSENVRGAFTDYLKDEFRRKAVRDGQINEAGARSFMAKYDDLFADQPALRGMFEEAIQDGNLAAVGGRIQDGAARVLGANNPAAEIRRIKNQAKADRTGAVWASFRRGLTGELLERARVRNPRGDIDGEIISGSTLLEMLDGERMGPALRQAYNKTELANLRRIANTAHRIERDIGSRQAADLVTDEPSALSTLIAGYAGALTGAKASRAAGGGAAGLRTAALVSGYMQRMVRKGVRDPAKDLIESALNDKAKMDLLMTPTTQANYESRVVPRINAWLLALGDEIEAREDGLDIDQPREPERGLRPGPAGSFSNP